MILPLVNFVSIVYFVHPDWYSTHRSQMYHENQQTLQNTAALEFTLLRMSIETGNIDFIKIDYVTEE